VFRAGRYWVPHWYRATHPVAYWDVFDHPLTLPRYQIDNYSSSVGERILWWYDAAKAAKVEQAK
jgi:microcin C transport system substrate-binding protein